MRERERGDIVIVSEREKFSESRDRVIVIKCAYERHIYILYRYRGREIIVSYIERDSY